MFGVFETYLGHGITIGSILGYGVHGRRTGELVNRVLNGEFMNNFTERTWTLVTVNQAIKELMKTYRIFAKEAAE